MSKHTPGPWVARPINTAQMNIRNDQDTIATVYRHIGSPTLMDRAFEGDANARLIAAAPEMRKTLDALAAQVERSNAKDDHGHELKHLKALHDARALLARIDGE